MKPIYKLMVSLERFDTFPAGDALTQALEELFPPEAETSELADGYAAAESLFQSWKTNNSPMAWNSMVEWTDQRLTAWHSFKINALETAWQTDPAAEDLNGMLKKIVSNLRQGINEQPELLADAHFLQSLAKQKHSFSFTQAIKELRGELNLPEDDRALTKHCAVCANAFKYLIVSESS